MNFYNAMLYVAIGQSIRRKGWIEKQNLYGFNGEFELRVDEEYYRGSLDTLLSDYDLSANDWEIY